MGHVKLRDKGQITLPDDIRKKLDASKGDIFNVELIDDQVVMTLQKLVPARSTQDSSQSKKADISRFIGMAKGTFGSVEQIDAYIRNERSSWD